MSLDQFIHMGGYGVYVWTTYGITLFVFGLNLSLVFLEKRAIKKMAKQYFARVVLF